MLNTKQSINLHIRILQYVQMSITLEKLNGSGYTTNVHIFILGSRNMLSFTSISLSMWEEL
jgi:hypothetical protein